MLCNGRQSNVEYSIEVIASIWIIKYYSCSLDKELRIFQKINSSSVLAYLGQTSQ